MEAKTCSTCKLDLPFSNFARSKKGKYGLVHVCRACQKIYSDAWYRRKHPFIPKDVPAEGYKRCSICKTDKPLSDFGNARKTSDKLRCECKICNRNSRKRWEKRHGKEYRDTLKAEALSAYGIKCACCGVNHPAFLTIDHINNDGAEHRRRYNINTGRETYLWLRSHNFPPGFQVLCANCNHGKNVNKGICPHQEKSNG